jgi:hypothetical protein
MDDTLAIASLKQLGHKQSSAFGVGGEMCGSSVHQQASFAASAPHVKLAPQFEQTFCVA